MIQNVRTLIATAAVGVAVGLIFAAAKAQNAPPTQPAPAQNAAPKPQQYMILPYETKAEIAERTGANPKAYWGKWADFGKKLAEAGVLAGGSALQNPSAARTVRLKDGKPQIRDGAYGDAKEQLSGYFTIQTDSMEEAVRWASQRPAVVNGGAVEVRPTVPQMASDMK